MAIKLAYSKVPLTKFHTDRIYKWINEAIANMNQNKVTNPTGYQYWLGQSEGIQNRLILACKLSEPLLDSAIEKTPEYYHGKTDGERKVSTIVNYTPLHGKLKWEMFDERFESSRARLWSATRGMMTVEAGRIAA